MNILSFGIAARRPGALLLFSSWVFLLISTLSAEAQTALGSSYSPFWELDIDDASFQNPLLFRSATLTLFTSVPEPGTIGWGGVVVLALVVGARQRRPSID